VATERSQERHHEHFRNYGVFLAVSAGVEGPTEQLQHDSSADCTTTSGNKNKYTVIALVMLNDFVAARRESPELPKQVPDLFAALENPDSSSGFRVRLLLPLHLEVFEGEPKVSRHESSSQASRHRQALR
jgi:hypothetical protein